MSNRKFSRSGSGIVCRACGTPNLASAKVCIECLSALSSSDLADGGDLGEWQPPARPQRKRAAGTRSMRGAASPQITTRHNRAAVIRDQARRAELSGPRQPKKKAWWNDWKLGALALGALSLMGLRKTNIGENLADLPNNVEQWIDDNVI
jgi:hypothetical protein